MPLWNSSTDSNQYDSSVEKPVAETSCQRHTRKKIDLNEKRASRNLFVTVEGMIRRVGKKGTVLLVI